MQKEQTHSLLLKSSTPTPPGTDQRWGQALLSLLGCSARLQSVSTAQAENKRPMQHIYVHFHQPMSLQAADTVAHAKLWRALTGHEAQVSRLHCVMRREGVSHAETPGVHYVVETDPEPGWQEEIFRWYDEEHMPGLSQVPGTVLAQRFLNLDHSPRSFACYDLRTADVLGSAPWLAVRGTAWSDVCRPHFTNTLRTLFNTLHPCT